jgi:hypothetical protein
VMDRTAVKLLTVGTELCLQPGLTCTCKLKGLHLVRNTLFFHKGQV